ncbi:MAG: pantoate--beta-alanine ligase [Chitinophagaceae bacterium]
MILFKQADTLSRYLAKVHLEGKTTGFVPTMGALHDGHLALVESAKTNTDVTVVSIFVNPTQFNDPADFKKYPVSIDQDVRLLLEHGADILFLPSQTEIYPAGTGRPKQYELGTLESRLEGAFRPGHFQGVCQVMDRLLGIVTPDRLFMGRKDYQQCMIIEKLIRLEKFTTKLEIVNTVRESDGLAMSSRNMRLSARERSIAPSIYEALQYVKKNIQQGNQELLLAKAKELLAEHSFRIEYLELTDAENLEPVCDWDGKRGMVAIVAGFINEVRLIDNLPV